tara:strand:+ start:3092 stop:3910 length:819 start_codon:yes stop_codon:yes gene_type:complete
MPKTRTVSEIKSNLLRPALTSVFEVELGIPNELRSKVGSEQDQLNLLCSEAVLPGSQLATFEVNNDYQGVTERRAYRRVFDDRIDLTFYVDAKNYVPIRFFESWIALITNEDTGNPKSEYFNYRMSYPVEYQSDGLKVTKFEKDHQQKLSYEFIKSYPIAISSMPISYEGSNLLRCTVSLTYIRYVPDLGNYKSPLSTIFDVFDDIPIVGGILGDIIGNPLQQSIFNAGGIPDRIAAAAGNVVSDVTGNRFVGALADRFVGGKINQVLGNLF